LSLRGDTPSSKGETALKILLCNSDDITQHDIKTRQISAGIVQNNAETPREIGSAGSTGKKNRVAFATRLVDL